MEVVEFLNVKEDEPIILKDSHEEQTEKQLQKEPIEKRFPQECCELRLCHLEKFFNKEEDSIVYYKPLLKRLKQFKKDVYDNLTAEEKQFIILLDMYPMTIIQKAIKENINEMNDILKKK